MLRQPSTSAGHPAPASRADVVQIVGALDDAKVVAILALKPTVSELEQAVIWAAGEGDVLSRKGHQLVGVVAGIVDILGVDEEEETARQP